MKFPPADLEAWMRKAYFRAKYDLGSSGVANFTLRELRALIDLDIDELDELQFCDSQTLGDERLRQAVATRYGSGDGDCVMVTNGSTESNYLLHLALIKPGDEVIVLDPVYQQLASLAAGLGAKLRKWQLREHEGFAPNLERLKACITKDTRLVIVNFPHNPTGVSITLDQLDQLIDVVADVDAWLLWDAAFAEMRCDGQPALPDPVNKYDRAISIGTLSKAFGLPGLRVGWCIAPREVLASCINLRDYISLHPSPLAERIAYGAITHADAVIDNRMKTARENLVFCEHWAQQNSDLITWQSPQGGVCSFPELNPAVNVDTLCERMAFEHEVLIVPGRCFGMRQRIRFGFGGSSKSLQYGVERLTGELKACCQQ